MELIINLKKFEPICQSTLEKLFTTSAILTGNFPDKTQLCGQQIFKDKRFHKKQRTKSRKVEKSGAAVEAV